METSKGYSLIQLDTTSDRQLNYAKTGTGAFALRDFSMHPKIPTAFLAVNEMGDYIGRAAITFEDDPDFFVVGTPGATCPVIYAVFVEEEYRGLGIGMALIQMCLDYLKHEVKSEWVTLDTNTAGPWYRDKFGFEYSHSAYCNKQMYDVFVKKLN